VPDPGGGRGGVIGGMMEDVGAAKTSIERLGRFLSQPLSAALARLASNDVFEACDGSLRLCERKGAVPAGWLAWLRSVGPADHEGTLRRLATDGDLRSAPSSLIEYLSSCASLPFDRSMSSTPRFATRSGHLATASGPATLGDDRRAAVGLSAKKAHEVERCLGIITSVLGDVEHPHVLDLGSGRGHLSRALTEAPLGAHVLAIDGDASQRDGAEHLDRVGRAKVTGSLQHRVQRLDEQAIGELLEMWTSKQADAAKLCIGLHACGQLSVDILRAFAAATEPTLPLVLVPCCYNLMPSTSFPMADATKTALPDLELSRDALMVATQCPQHWASSDAEWARARLALRKLGYRARLEAELRNSGVTIAEEVRIGRLRDAVCADWATYRTAALGKLGLAATASAGGASDLQFPGVAVPPVVVEHAAWTELAFVHAAVWTIRARLGPVIEAMIALDRFVFLAERLPDRAVEVHALFDRFGSGSLRNLALVVRP